MGDEENGSESEESGLMTSSPLGPQMNRCQVYVCSWPRGNTKSNHPGNPVCKAEKDMLKRRDMHTDSAVIVVLIAIVDIVLDDSKGLWWHCVRRWLGKGSWHCAC